MQGLEADSSGLYIAGQLSDVVYLVSSKSAADSLHNHIGGCFVAPSKKWNPEPLRDRLVVILSQKRPAAEKIAATLHGVAESVRLADLPEGVNTLIAEKSPAEAWKLLVELTRSAPEWGSPDGFVNGDNSENGFLGFSGPDISKNPIFPVEEYSRELRNFSVWSGSSLQTAVDMPAVSVLTMASLCAQRKFRVHPNGNRIRNCA